MRGIRARVTVIAAVAVALLLTAVGAALVATQRFVLTESVDEVLARQADVVVAELDAGDKVGSGGTPTRLPAQGDDEAFAVLLDRTGRIVAETPGGSGDVGLPEPRSRADADRVVVRTVEAGDPRDGRVRLRSQGVGGDTLVVGTPLDDVDESVATLTTGLAVAVPGASALLGVLVWLLVGRVLRPVEAIRRRVAEIDDDSLNARVPVPGTGDEIARLAATMNGMLDRLAESADRQGRFVADASHELRTPLARMRADLDAELAVAPAPLSATSGTPPAPADHRSAPAPSPDPALPAPHPSEVLRRTRTTVIAMQELVDDLLLAARPGGEVAATPVDLDDAVFREVDALRVVHPHAIIDVSAVSAGRASGRRTHLERVVRNLLENALQHGRSPVIVELAECDGRTVLSVADSGDGVPEADRERVFDRFVRVDAARDRDTGGTGLGLSIARRIVTAHGGTIGFEGPTRVTVRLPNRRDPPGAAQAETVATAGSGSREPSHPEM